MSKSNVETLEEITRVIYKHKPQKEKKGGRTLSFDEGRHTPAGRRAYLIARELSLSGLLGSE